MWQFILCEKKDAASTIDRSLQSKGFCEAGEESRQVREAKV